MTLRPRDRIALAVVALLALMGAFYILVYKAEQKKASALGASIASQRQALAQAQSSYAAGRAAQASLKTTAPDWAALRRAVPDTSDIPALLRTLERNAKAVHVQMTAIQLNGGTAGGTAGASGAPTPSAAAPSTTTTTTSGTATSVPLSLSFTGGYTELHSLVRRLDGLVVVSGNKVRATGPLLSISSVSLTGSPKLTVQLTATIYQLAGTSTAASATTGGTS